MCRRYPSRNLTDSSDGRSYQNINSLGIGDWVKNKYKTSKVVSISGKDRAAIILGGKKPDIAIWYDRKGQYTTSTSVSYTHLTLPTILLV